MSLHQIRTHPEPLAGCFGCHIGDGPSIAYCGIGGGDATRQKKWDTELAAYRDAKAQGVQPETTRSKDIGAAMRWSEKNGVAYSAEVKQEATWNKALERQ